MYKIALLYKRRLPLPVEIFQQRWLSEHSVRICKVPGLLKYVQSHALPQGYRKGELLFDGIEELWFADEEAGRRAQTSEEWAAVAKAGDDLFDTERTVILPIELHVIKDGPIPKDGVKNIEFVTRRPGLDLAEFRRYWREIHGPLASRIPTICRYEQNHTVLSAYVEGRRPAYDGLAITWFESTGAMKEGAKTREYAETRADEAAFLPDGHLPIIITREHTIIGASFP